MKYIWDNSNIVESYPGVCSPLTFSFARYVYREVYLQAAPLFGVDRRVVEKLYRTLETFLGYVDGHFYYNLGTWCTLISYLPGFSENPKLLQEMMGVQPNDRIEIPEVQIPRSTKAKAFARFAYYHFALERMSNDWIAQFDNEFPEHVRKLEALGDPQQVMSFFFDVEYRYLRHWQIPILNDFAVMIYSGLLRNTSRRYGLGELDPKQITGIGETGNTRMIQEIKQLAKAVRGDPALLEGFRTMNPDALWGLVLTHPEMRRLVDQFLIRFGLRNGHNLKLETPNLIEEPTFFVNLVRQYVLIEEIPASASGPAQSDALPQSLPLAQRMVLDFLIKHTKRAVRRREEMRYKRSQIFGLVRQVFLKLGTALADRGVLDQPSDIFYLEMDEVFGLLQGTSTVKDPRVLLHQRRMELAATTGRPIRSHFTTEGIPFQDVGRYDAQKMGDLPHELVGSPNFPAQVSGEVLVMERPDFSQDVRGKILVCRQTDPNWVPFLGLVKGMIVERGGILSHAAIVCRELRVPSVIGVERATEILQSGQRVHLDSVSGKIEVL